jgi:hypothetical protein
MPKAEERLGEVPLNTQSLRGHLGVANHLEVRKEAAGEE